MFPPLLCLVLLFGLLLCFPLSIFPLPVFALKERLNFREQDADSVISQIILDNTRAAEQIPKDARGRFITGDGTVFQGYLFDEGQL